MLLAAIRTGTRPDGTPIDAAPGTAVGAGSAVDAGAGPTGTDPTAGATATAGAAATTTAAAEAPPRPLDDLLAELDDLVGMKEVKDEIKLVTNVIRVQQLRRDRGLKALEQSHHLIFTGNPGTGKTTVARLLAQIYRTLGVVARGQLVETDRAGLVAGYVGQTAPKVVSAFDRAEEGVLLIDEAYALIREANDAFGQEAIDTIVKLMEDRRDRVVVVAAGYPDEMADFVGSNPGLESRFPKTIHFPDYSTDELVAIFSHLCEDSTYTCPAPTLDAVRAWFDAHPRTKGFGNGRLARNLFEEAVSTQATRVVAIADPTDDDLVTLLPADIPGHLADPPPAAAPEAATPTADRAADPAAG
jgi:SpoVK/Ycf46/Vps4 family AAA+-type ATPase